MQLSETWEAVNPLILAAGWELRLNWGWEAGRKINRGISKSSVFPQRMLVCGCPSLRDSGGHWPRESEPSKGDKRLFWESAVGVPQGKQC